jgi:hypothetical protein
MLEGLADVGGVGGVRMIRLFGPIDILDRSGKKNRPGLRPACPTTSRLLL